MRQRRDGADLDEAEAEAKERARDLRILVEAGRKADRIWKIQPKGADRQPRIVAGDLGQRKIFEALQRQTVGSLRLERPQEWPGEAVEKAHQDGKLRGPSRRDPIGEGEGLQGKARKALDIQRKRL